MPPASRINLQLTNWPSRDTVNFLRGTRTFSWIVHRLLLATLLQSLPQHQTPFPTCPSTPTHHKTSWIEGAIWLPCKSHTFLDFMLPRALARLTLRRRMCPAPSDAVRHGFHRRRSHLSAISNTFFHSESFDNIYLDLSKESGKSRFAENGLGWKPAGGGEAFTLDSSNIGGAQWSRAARGYEVKILLRSSGVVQLDGFHQEVRNLFTRHRSEGTLTCCHRITSALARSSRTGTA